MVVCVKGASASGCSSGVWLRACVCLCRQVLCVPIRVRFRVGPVCACVCVCARARRNVPVSVSAGVDHLAVIDINMHAYLWGDGPCGQLGLDRVDAVSRPHLVCVRACVCVLTCACACGKTHTP